MKPRKPTALARRPSPLREVPPRPGLERLIGPANSYLRTYELGECSVIVTREFEHYHLSIAHSRRYPTWDEIAEAWYRVVPGAAGRTGVLVLPPLHEYINFHPNCFQVHEVDGAGAPGGDHVPG